MLPKILAKAKEQGKTPASLVREGDTFYLVLNSRTFDPNFLAVVTNHLDTVEKSEGAACMITIGNGKHKHFHTGFDLQYFL